MSSVRSRIERQQEVDEVYTPRESRSSLCIPAPTTVSTRQRQEFSESQQEETLVPLDKERSGYKVANTSWNKPVRNRMDRVEDVRREQNSAPSEPVADQILDRNIAEHNRRTAERLSAEAEQIRTGKLIIL
jgi:hypothetical protein